MNKIYRYKNKKNKNVIIKKISSLENKIFRFKKSKNIKMIEKQNFKKINNKKFAFSLID